MSTRRYSRAGLHKLRKSTGGDTPEGLAIIASAVQDASESSSLSSALRALELEYQGLAALKVALQSTGADDFRTAIELIRNSSGRLIVTGMGKSGHVGQKVAATFSSTGTPSYFVHPSEASHGDLGMITSQDVLLAFSWSGETAELTNIITYSHRYSVPLVSVTSQAESTLAKSSGVALILPRAQEACPHGLAPTTSTLMQLALGDALAIALLESKCFTAEQFKKFHPGGQLGASLTFVGDIMHQGADIPLIDGQGSMADGLVIMTEKSFGCLGVVNARGRLIGMITDGDLRRNMGPDLLTRRALEMMTPDPKTASPELLAGAALKLINSSSITALFVVEDEKPVGIIHIHDLLRLGVA